MKSFDYTTPRVKSIADMFSPSIKQYCDFCKAEATREALLHTHDVVANKTTLAMHTICDKCLAECRAEDSVWSDYALFYTHKVVATCTDAAMPFVKGFFSQADAEQYVKQAKLGLLPIMDNLSFYTIDTIVVEVVQ